MKTIDSARIAALMLRERRQFIDNHPKSRAFSERARTHLLSGAPLPWMREWHTPFNVYAARASGATVTDVDGHEYADFCLGDTGAMFGHSPAALVEMAADNLAGGITHMLPTEDSLWLGEELSRRFHLKYWSFAR